MVASMRVLALGQQPYGAVLKLQQRIVEARKLAKTLSALRTTELVGHAPLPSDDLAWSAVPDVLLLVEHPPTYTVGRRMRNDSPDIAGAMALVRQGRAELFKVDRGGQATFHGFGQLVGYPILEVHRFKPTVRDYVDSIEQTLIDTCGDYGVPDAVRTENTGVWVGNGKIAAIGVQVSYGITWHGFALNIDVDLSFFKHIVACGLPDKVATSMAEEMRKKHPTQDVRPTVAGVSGDVVKNFAKAMGVASPPFLAAEHQEIISKFLITAGGQPSPVIASTTQSSTTSDMNSILLMEAFSRPTNHNSGTFEQPLPQSESALSSPAYSAPTDDGGRPMPTAPSEFEPDTVSDLQPTKSEFISDSAVDAANKPDSGWWSSIFSSRDSGDSSDSGDGGGDGDGGGGGD